jgi:glycerol-3-phosphate dehydrogenase
MIDPETAVQLKALSEENESLREDISLLSAKLEANNANLVQYMEVQLSAVRDAANRATQAVTEFGGQLEVFSGQQVHFLTEFAWWATHLDALERRAEATIKKMDAAEARLELSNTDFKDWALTKITQIGRIFRR